MADMTRQLASAIDIGFYNFAGSLSGTHQTITYNISSLTYDQETLSISALLDWNTVEFLKTFGIVFKDTFGLYLNSTTVPGWTISNTGAGAITHHAETRFGTISFTNPAITDSTYMIRNIIIPRKEFVTYGASRYGANFKIYEYVYNVVDTEITPYVKIGAYFADNGRIEANRELLAPTRTTTSPIEIPLNLAAETYASKKQDYFIVLKIGSYSEVIAQRISAVVLFAFPGNDTPSSDEIPFVCHYGHNDISKEGFVVSFDVSDGTTTRKYVFTGCSVSAIESFGATDDVQANIQFKYRSMSVGEVWS